MPLVEYHDPDGLFPRIEKQLSERLPLKDLRWTSPSGSLHTVNALDVDFVPTAKKPFQAPTPAHHDADDVVSNSEASRRHQLSGLQQTPFLGLYILRCDDKEQYKAVKRDAIRAWLDSRLPTVKGNKATIRHAAHDAREWIIFHVVLPNTTAASESRWTRDSESEIEPSKDKILSGSNWPGKRPRSLLDRLRADFNPSGRSTLDRIAQICLQSHELYVNDLALAAPVSAAPSEGHNDVNRAWTGFSDKLRSFMLITFDSRVKQYNQDIQEKESQRSLPGWNFCTFFILREGLAMTYETMAFVDEALREYKELLTAVDQALEEWLKGQPSDVFVPFSDETCGMLQRMTKDGHDTTVAIASAFQRSLDPSRKDYRGLIAASTISAFDFKCYVHARIWALLIRSGTQRSRKVNTGTNPGRSNNNSERTRAVKETFDDPILLAEVCADGKQCLPLLARLLRHDLKLCAASLEGVTPVRVGLAIDVAVTAWTYAAAKYLYTFTASDIWTEPLEEDTSHHRRQTQPTMSANGINGYEEIEPLRTSSYSQGSRLNVAFISDEIKGAANSRAMYCLLQKRHLEQMRAWNEDAPATRPSSVQSTEPTHHLEADSRDGVDFALPARLLLQRLTGSDLSDVLSSLDTIDRELERLEKDTTALLRLAGRGRLASAIPRSLAVQTHDDGVSASVGQLVEAASALVQHERWTFLSQQLRKTHAHRLQILGRADEMVYSVLSLVAKDSGRRELTEYAALQSGADAPQAWSDDNSLDIGGMFDMIVPYAGQLQSEVQLQLTQFFNITSMDEHITLPDDSDGFSLTIGLRTLVTDSIKEAHVALELYGSGGSEDAELHLCSNGAVEILNHPTRIKLTANVTTFGAYRPARISVRIGKLAFVHEAIFKPRPHNPLVLPQQKHDRSTPIGRAKVIQCYPRAAAFKADLIAARRCHFGKKRCLELSLSSGSNVIHRANVMLKSNTAGLRIHTATATLIDGSLHLETTTPGAINVGGLNPNEVAHVSIEYDIEHETVTLSIQLDIQYETPRGQYMFRRQTRVPSRLLADVNVRDVFHTDSIQSTFYMTPVQSSPVIVSHVFLAGSPEWTSEGIAGEQRDLPALSKQPASISYDIQPAPRSREGLAGVTHSLRLEIIYRCTYEDVTWQIDSQLGQDLRRSDFERYTELIVATCGLNISQHLSRQALENFAVMGVCELPMWHSFDWSLAFESLPVLEATRLREWLSTWHTHREVKAAEVEEWPPPYRLYIEYEVPSMEFLYTASIGTEGIQALTLGDDQCSRIITGSAIGCRLTIKCTNHWSSKPSSDPTTGHLVKCHVIYDPSAWIACGPLQFTFTSNGQDSHVFEITLTALKAGFAILPTVDVAPLIPGYVSSAPNTASSWTGLRGYESVYGLPGSGRHGIMHTGRVQEEKSASTNGIGEEWPTWETRCTTAGNGVLVVDSCEESVTIGVSEGGSPEVQSCRQ